MRLPSLLPLFTLLVKSADALSAPQCQNLAPIQQSITLPSGNLTVSDSPFGIVYYNTTTAFAIVANTLAILNTTALTPALQHTLPFPQGIYTERDPAGSMILNKNKTELYIAVGKGALVYNVQKALANQNDSASGYLTGMGGVSALQVTLSIDEKYVFVSQEYGTSSTIGLGNIEALQINRAANGSLTGTSVGQVQLEIAVVGTALSADGSKLYAPSELTLANYIANKTNDTGMFGGSLSVLDVQQLIKNSSSTLLWSVPAGCEPVRVVLAPSGDSVWVTARSSNTVVVFNTTKLNSNATKDDAVMATIQVGEEPVGFAFINNGTHAVSADSNRMGITNATTGLTIINVKAALNGTQGFPRLATGLFPREFGVSPDGSRFLVTQFLSKAIQAVDVSSLMAQTQNAPYKGDAGKISQSPIMFVVVLVALVLFS